MKMIYLLFTILLFSNSTFASDFTNASIKGDYGFSTGLGMAFLPELPEPLPSVGLGIVSFDGKGACSVKTTVNLGGQVSTFSADTCVYTVNSDGTGTSTAYFSTAPVPGEVPVSFVIVDHGKEIRFINANFLVSSFVAKRM